MEFLYLGPSFSDYRKAVECDIWFKNEVKPEERKELEKYIPYPLSRISWGTKVLHCASDDFFCYRVRNYYGTILRKLNRGLLGPRFAIKYRANRKELAKFYKLLDSGLEALHKIHPILFFLKPVEDVGNEGFQEEFSQAHHQSLEKIETEIVPVITQFLQNENISKEDKSFAAWIVDGFFSFGYIPQKISKEYAQKLEILLKASMGTGSYIDGYLKNDLARVQGSLRI